MNWVIDRLLVLGLVLVIVGAIRAMALFGVEHVGESCGLAAAIATCVTSFAQRSAND
jgi:hypothetical protein